MIRALALWLAIGLFPVAAHAGAGRLQILFTGDNGGEVAPCG